MRARITRFIRPSVCVTREFNRNARSFQSNEKARGFYYRDKMKNRIYRALLFPHCKGILYQKRSLAFPRFCRVMIHSSWIIEMTLIKKKRKRILQDGFRSIAMQHRRGGSIIKRTRALARERKYINRYSRYVVMRLMSSLLSHLARIRKSAREAVGASSIEKFTYTHPYVLSLPLESPAAQCAEYTRA